MELHPLCVQKQGVLKPFNIFSCYFKLHVKNSSVPVTQMWIFWDFGWLVGTLGCGTLWWPFMTFMIYDFDIPAQSKHENNLWIKSIMKIIAHYSLFSGVHFKVKLILNFALHGLHIWSLSARNVTSHANFFKLAPRAFVCLFGPDGQFRSRVSMVSYKQINLKLLWSDSPLNFLCHRFIVKLTYSRLTFLTLRPASLTVAKR